MSSSPPSAALSHRRANAGTGAACPGETVLVTVLGWRRSAIVQLARARGAVPIAVAALGQGSGDARHRRASRRHPGSRRPRRSGGGGKRRRPIDVVADLVGGPLFNDLLKILRPKAATPPPAQSPAGRAARSQEMYLKQLEACTDRARAAAPISAASSVISRRERSGRSSAASIAIGIPFGHRRTSWAKNFVGKLVVVPD